MLKDKQKLPPPPRPLFIFSYQTQDPELNRFWIRN
jgi:hypothetical protein